MSEEAKVEVGDVVELGSHSRYARMIGIVYDVRDGLIIVTMRVPMHSGDEEALDCPIRVKNGAFRLIARKV